jgi:DNA-binding transcriptional regulator GbsR (MarR family)
MPDDLRQIVRILAKERRKREVDPTLSLLHDIIVEIPGSTDERHAQATTREMHGFIDLLTVRADDAQKLDNDSLMRLRPSGRGVSPILEFKGMVTALRPGRTAADEEGVA